MLRFEHRGPASSQGLWPLTALASADPDRISSISDMVVSCKLMPSGTLEFHADDPVLTLIVKDGAGEVIGQAVVQAWGDEDSESYWWPFVWLGATPDEENLREAISRTKITFERISFYDQEPVQVSDGKEAAAIDYLRLASGVTEEWIISLAAPHELILEGASFDGGHGVLHRFGELPPGLADRGECALISEDFGDENEWCMRPVMCVFDNELDDLTLEDLRESLVGFGFTAEEIDRLSHLAAEVNEAYAWETEGELRQCHTC